MNNAQIAIVLCELKNVKMKFGGGSFIRLDNICTTVCQILPAIH
jgi:hypothetical protein